MFEPFIRSDEEFNLLQALAYLYEFDPKKEKKALKFSIEQDGKEYIVFGKGYNKVLKEATYFCGEPDLAFGCEEEHFVSNLMCDIKNHFGRAIYSAQQGEYTVVKWTREE